MAVILAYATTAMAMPVPGRQPTGSAARLREALISAVKAAA
jgi:hypothetical protein